MPKIKFRKRYFLITFSLIVATLFTIKTINPDITLSKLGDMLTNTQPPSMPTDTVGRHSLMVDAILHSARRPSSLLTKSGEAVKNKVLGVHSFEESFPDLNDVQLATASSMGIETIANRDEAARRQDELVYIDDNPYYHVKRLNHSIPYLVPRAALLLEEIGRAFIDSLSTKGFPMHQIVVTSVLRTEADVKRLQRFNANATTQSCHQYGTTFDIGYNIFERVQQPGKPEQPGSNGVLLKSILSEVLRDMREQGLCYVKHEHKQSCFHITAR